MSPHNYSRFNGSNVNSPSSYHKGQEELGLAMGRLTDRVNKAVFKYSGLYAFYNSRIFSRGITGDKLSDFDHMYSIHTSREAQLNKI
jgi:hypothetical protein